MGLDLTDPTAALLATADALARARIEAALYGGLALAAYGVPRETKDADLAVIAATGPQAEAALRAAGMNALVAFERMRFGGNRVTRLTLLPGADASGLNTADLVEPLSPRYARLCVSRAYTGVLRGEQLRIVTPEDFVILKLLSTRERDLEDALTVLTSLAEQIDGSLIDAEVSLLAGEIPDHDVRERHRRVRDMSSVSR